MTNIKSIIREGEYAQVEKLTLTGTILDIGGSTKSGYHELIKGTHSFFVVNLDPACEPNLFHDIETPFPLQDSQFDNAICLNVLEHIFETNLVFSEIVRCVKSGGTLAFATPFMHHIHGSPDDYLRYTESAYRRLAEKNNCKITSITTLGEGFFSLGYQCIFGALPNDFLKHYFKRIAIRSDMFLNKISRKYRTLSSRLPLGHFVVMVKQ
ncbi:MAG: methyltransferase domain-containing protein [Patescibacteria group bacterium]